MRPGDQSCVELQPVLPQAIDCEGEFGQSERYGREVDDQNEGGR